MSGDHNSEAHHPPEVTGAIQHGHLLKFFTILGAQYLLAFATGVLIARILGPTDRGRLTFFLTIPQWALVVVGLGAPQAITYLIASRRFSQSESLSVVFTVLLTLGGAILILALALLAPWSPAFKRFTMTEAGLVSVLSFASIALAILLAVILGWQQTLQYFLFQLVAPVCFLVALAVLFSIRRLNYSTVIAANTAIMIISCAVVAYAITRRTGFRLRLRFGFWRPILGYGLKIYVGSILSLVIVRMDVFFVAAFLGFTALGYYAVAVQMAEVVYRLASVFATARLPETASRSKADADQTFPALSRQLILLSLVVMSIIAVAGTAFIRIFLPAFRPAIPAMLLLLPGSTFLGLANLYFAELGGRGRAGYGSSIIAANSVTMVILDLLIIPLWGINGAAIASSLVYGMGFAFALYAVQRESDIRLLDLILVRPRDLLVYKSLIARA